MKKTKTVIRPRTLQLKKETIIHLPTDHLKDVAGGNTTTVASQCRTLCFT